MIKDGMWFENEAHYQYYLKRMKEARDKVKTTHPNLFDILIKRLKEIIAQQAKKRQEKEKQ